MDVTFPAEVWEWRGPAPYFWAVVPPDVCDELRDEAAQASYGWGAVPVLARVGATAWETSLLPKDGGYVVPIKQAVRRAEGIDLGDVVELTLTVAPRRGRQANGSGAAR